MKKHIYTLFIVIYQLLICIASRFNRKALKFLQGRQNILKDIKKTLNIPVSSIIWIHCASLGEFEQARPLIEYLHDKCNNYKILLTFFSPSGYEVRKNYTKAHYIFYLPLDYPYNAKKFIEIVNPALVLFVKYELWYNYLTELQKKQIPVILFSAIFQPNQIFFKFYGGFFRALLRKFTYIFVQNNASQELLKTIHINNCAVAGDTRFDRVNTIQQNPVEDIGVKKFKNNQKLFLIGSSWPQDIDFLWDFIHNSPQGLKIVIAPHEIHMDYLQNLQKSIVRKTTLYSQLDQVNHLEDFEVLIIDNIGLLAHLYQYADFAYIGGAFGKGLHNILEAATFGMPIFFGTKYNKFQEAIDLVNLKAAFSATVLQDFEKIFNELYENETLRQQKAYTCRAYVAEHVGSTEKILNYIYNRFLCKD